MMDIGILTFGEVTTDPTTGQRPPPQQRVAETIEQAKVADEVGLDILGIGEHHRSDFIASAPVALLAGAATVTSNIRHTNPITWSGRTHPA